MTGPEELAVLNHYRSIDSYGSLFIEKSVPTERGQIASEAERYARVRGIEVVAEHSATSHIQITHGNKAGKYKVTLLHYASPLIDEMIAMLYSHPQVYVDIAQNNWGFPRAHFYSQLKRLIDAGFEERIMWGSDQMAWPGTIKVAIETIEKASFLSAKQKRDIFYNNAARFLRFSEEEIERHHRK